MPEFELRAILGYSCKFTGHASSSVHHTLSGEHAQKQNDYKLCLLVSWTLPHINCPLTFSKSVEGNALLGVSAWANDTRDHLPLSGDESSPAHLEDVLGFLIFKSVGERKKTHCRPNISSL